MVSVQFISYFNIDEGRVFIDSYPKVILTSAMASGNKYELEQLIKSSAMFTFLNISNTI